MPSYYVEISPEARNFLRGLDSDELLAVLDAAIRSRLQKLPASNPAIRPVLDHPGMARLLMIWKEETYLIVYTQLRKAELHRRGRYGRQLGFCVDVIVHLEQHYKKVEIQDGGASPLHSGNGGGSTATGEVTITMENAVTSAKSTSTS